MQAGVLVQNKENLEGLPEVLDLFFDKSNDFDQLLAVQLFEEAFQLDEEFQQSAIKDGLSIAIRQSGASYLTSRHVTR